MERMRRVAFQTVLRACLFGALAIFCLMVGLSYELKLSLKAGGLLTVLMAVVLMYKAYEARTKPYRKTPRHIVDGLRRHFIILPLTSRKPYGL